MKRPTIETIQIPCRGETACGDQYTIIEDGPILLVAVADGLGHGPKAEEASRGFCEYVQEHPQDGMERLFKGATKAISRTRGVAAAVVRIDLDDASMTFAGVGNIELQSVSKKPIRPVCTPGIVGRPLRKVVQFDYELSPGDLVAIYSDGISSRFALADYKFLQPEEAAAKIHEANAKAHDDQTLIVMRF
jgi:serine phosphatase RsbU (regulator of sigma subunit)